MTADRRAEARARPTPDVLRGLLLEWERRYAQQEHAFALTAARDLPGKARDRLAQAHDAHNAGAGALLEILRQLVSSGPRADRSSLASAAEALLSRMRAVSRNEIWSAGDLKVRAPLVQAPALAAGTAAAGPSARRGSGGRSRSTNGSATPSARSSTTVG